MKLSLAPLLSLVLAACSGASTSTSSEAPPAPEAPRLATVVQGSEVGRALWGERVVVRVSGLRPGREITLASRQHSLDPSAPDAIASATFLADETGAVDTSLRAPKEGSYEGVDVDGLVWSAVDAGDRDARIPRYGLRFELSIDGEVVASKLLERYLNSDTLRSVDVRDDGIVGQYLAPKDGAKHPAILAFGGLEGGLLSGASIAAYWAARGYSALGIAYFGAPGLPRYLSEIPLEYFEKAMRWLDAQPEVDTTKLAVIGGSRGGELALLLGATFPRVTAVVAQVPSGYTWAGLGTGIDEIAAWTRAAAPIPFLPSVEDVPPTVKTPDGKKANVFTPSFRASIAKATEEQKAKATIAVDQINGPVLLLGGGDDQLWPSCELGEVAMTRLRSSGHAARYADEITCADGGGHASILLPGSPTTDSVFAVSPYGVLALGGTPAANARAQRAADDATRAFLERALR